MTDAPETRGLFDRQRGMGVSAYLHLPISEVTDGTEPFAVLQAPFDAPPHMVDDEGRTGTGMLAAAADSIGGLACGLACLPDWIVTTNLTVRRASSTLRGPSGTGPLRLDTDVLRRGRSAVVSRTRIRSLDGAEVATTWMTGAVLTPAGGPPPFTRPVRPWTLPHSDDPLLEQPPEVFFGLRAGGAPGVVSLDLADHMRNPWGILHGGGIAVLIDSAARSAAAGGPLGPTPDHVVSDLVVHYLSPARVGPVTATARRLGRRGHDHLVRVSLVDHGADDRPVALSVATVRHTGRRGATVR